MGHAPDMPTPRAVAGPGGALERFLRDWVGQWPPSPGGPRIQVVASPSVTRPSWDGSTEPLVGVGDGRHTVIGVAPDRVEAVRRVISPDPGDREMVAAVNAALDVRGGSLGAGVFRWTHQVPPLPDTGTWMADDDQRMPPWLRPFNAGVLVATDHLGRYIGGVGIKGHNRFGQEVAVVTTPEARGRGVARRLVATSTRHILRQGMAPIYLHGRSNAPSARVAEACGYRDRGWTVHALWGARPLDA